MERFFEKITRALVENGNIREEEEEVYQYALKSMLILGGNILLSLMIGVCMGMPGYCVLHLNITIDDIAEICKAFDDDTKDDEVMFGIIHLIEQLQGEEYLKKIAICTPDMKEAHDWAMTLNKRIINSQKYFEKYIEIIGDLEKEYKEKILKLLVDVKNDNPKRFGDKINMLIERTV